MTVTEFLEARIAEDEAAARECEDSGAWSAFRHEEGLEWWVSSENFGHVVTTGYVGNSDAQPNAEHMARWDPARVLAECAAKRAIIRRHATITVWPDGTGGAKYYHGSKKVCASCDERTQTPCPTIGLLAAVYSDHPDYDKDWAL